MTATTYYISDLHGMALQYNALLDVVAKDPGTDASKRLVVLGDLCDRGPDSRAVVDATIDAFKRYPGSVLIRGNHDDWMLQTLNGNTYDTSLWIHKNGGNKTLASYGIDIDNARPGDSPVAAFRDAVPEAHAEFLRSASMYAEFGKHNRIVAVHAGIERGTPMHRQSPYTLIWDRSMIGDTKHYDADVFVVHGHTPAVRPLLSHNRIDIDTGCFATGRLTLMAVDETTGAISLRQARTFDDGKADSAGNAIESPHGTRIEVVDDPEVAYHDADGVRYVASASFGEFEWA